MIKIGFWDNKPKKYFGKIVDNCNYPVENSAKEDQTNLINKLIEIEKIAPFIDKLCFEKCKLCDQTNNVKEYRYNGMIFREDYRHYLETHNIEMDSIMKTKLFEVIENKNYHIGFWRKSRENIDNETDFMEHFPYPEENTWNEILEIKKELIYRLKNLMNSLEPVEYFGVSKCRICGCVNGSKEYNYKNTVFPEGYIHYLEAHNVNIDKTMEIILLNLGRNEPLYIGFWLDNEKPIENSASENQIEIIEKIKKYIGYSDIASSDSKTYSPCRICGIDFRDDGNKRYACGGLVFPKSYVHYLEVHNVAVDKKLKKILLNN